MATQDSVDTTLRRNLLASWAAFLLKNVIGWAFILGSLVLGQIPGPGGIPLFIIGFALITLPGKRQLAARVLRGRPFDRTDNRYRWAVTIAALLLPALVLLAIRLQWNPWKNAEGSVLAGWTAACYLAAVAAVGLLLRDARLVNWFVRKAPTIRRKIRPWMRRRGIDLLPPRRRRRFVTTTDQPIDSMDDSILEINPQQRTRLQHAWRRFKPWLKRVFGVVVTVAIFVWILKPIVRSWDLVRDRVLDTNWGRVFAASALFAVFLFVFRALVWRRLLKNFGHKLPIAVTTRIWITSELARYLPGSVWQVVGRVYLTKPYGVRGSVVSTSQILELALYLLANLIVALGAMAFLGYKTLDGTTRLWVIVAAILVPLLSLALHPKVFYPLTDRILKKLGKPAIQKRMRWKSMIDLLFWNILGLVVQGLAIYLVVFRLLELPLAKWWVVTGAYCLAWCAGFLAFWAPGGLGVREAVFIAAMGFAIPLATTTGQVADDRQRLFLIFLSVLLRIWATVGELLLAGVAYAADWKDAWKRPTPSPQTVGELEEETDETPTDATANPSESPAANARH
jgi:uncharacterized membrane protein YbhN (UPF0104 family)